MAQDHDIDRDYDYGDHHIDWDDRYEVLSSATTDPEDVSLWCATDTLWKAEAVFALLAAHGERLDIGFIGLRDRVANVTTRSSGKARPV